GRAARRHSWPGADAHRRATRLRLPRPLRLRRTGMRRRHPVRRSRGRASRALHPPRCAGGGGMSETLLELRDVTRTFALSQGVFRRASTLTAVAGVSLKVQRGEVFALVGESGSGKTTLAKMLLGLLPPTSGEILIGG